MVSRAPLNAKRLAELMTDPLKNLRQIAEELGQIEHPPPIKSNHIAKPDWERPMESFKEFVKRTGRRTVIVYFDQSDKQAAANSEKLTEGKTYQLDNRYAARFDRAHVKGQQDHLHVLLKGNEVCVINKDGTPSHNSTIELPDYVNDKIRELGLVIVESQDQQQLLLEAGGHTAISEMLARIIATIEAIS